MKREWGVEVPATGCPPRRSYPARPVLSNPALHVSIGEWADRMSLELPGGQPELLQALAAVGVPLALLLISGRPVTFGGATGDALLTNVSALLASYPPGQVSVTACNRPDR